MMLDSKKFDSLKFNAFANFCRENGVELLETSGERKGELTVQGQAVMEESNCIVAAGAGSGKTTVLSFRFLRMVAQGVSPERILTITFTKKATAEMKSRIYMLLQKGYKCGLVSDADMAKFTEVSISTVDSFCSEIVRSSAVHQGVPADFRIMDDEDLETISSSIIRALLNKHYNEPVIQHLYSLFSVENIESIFLDLARSHLNITKPIDIEHCIKALNAMLEEKRLELEEKRLNAQKVRKQPTKEESFYIKAIEDIPFMEDYYRLVSEYETELFSRKRASGVLSFNDVMQLAIKILREEIPTRDRFKTRFDSVMIDEFQDNNDDYRKLLYLLCEKTYREGAIRAYDNEGIPTLDSLSPCKIFLVGDEKQSIYRFRGADVSVFKRLSMEICNAPIELRKNWRSEPSIIHFCNHVFPAVMDFSVITSTTASTQVRESYEATYLPLEPRTALIEKSHIVLLHPNLSNEQATLEHSSIESEANVVAQFIEKICSSNSTFLVPDDNNKTLLRPPYPNEIGLLLKVGSHQSIFEKALTAKGIPYSVSEARSLVSDSVANDFYSALQASVYSYDAISYAAYLKSPFCSLSDSDLEDYLKDTEKDSNVANVAIEIANANLEKLSQVSSGGSICKTLEYLWYDMGYRDYMLARSLNRPYAEHFDYLYALAVDFDSKKLSLVAFLDYLRPLLGRGSSKTKEVTVFKEQISGVQIMTVHKSKGLAFKVVIVADMHSGARGPSGFQPNNFKLGDDVFMSYEPSGEISGSVKNPVKEIFKPIEKSMDNAETKRILYVAATRARYHLVFSGCIDEKTPLVTDPEKSNSMLTYLLNAIGYNPNKENNSLLGNGFELEDLCLEPHFEIPIPNDKDKDYYKPIFDSATIQTLPRGIKSIAVTQIENEIENEIENGESIEGEFKERKRLPSIESDKIIAENKLNTDFGTLVHFLIENRIKGMNENLEDLNSMLPPQLANKLSTKLASKEQQLLLNDAKKMADAFMHSCLYEKIKGYELLSEKRFLMFDGNSFIEGAIDLLALGAKEAFIIDFKTNSTCLPNDHKVQLLQYAKAVKSMYPQKKVKSFVCYLRDIDNYLEIS